MLLKLLLIVACSIAKSRSEAPLYNRAPYAPAGFRPNIPFDLPGEYYPSYEVDTEQQLPNHGITFEITKQRVDFAGQEIQGIIPAAEPQNQYLPPEQIVFVGNRVGNNNRGTRYYGHRHGHRRFNGNGGRHNGSGNDNGNGNGNGQTPSQTPQNSPPQFQPNLPPVNIPRPNINTDERFESQQRPALEYGAPNYNIDPRNAGRKQAQQPDLQHGAPFNNNNNLGFDVSNNYYQNQQQQKPALEYGAPAITENQREEALEKQFALDALKAAVETYNRLQENSIDKIAEGQYFVVNPDYSVQKVQFTTTKSEDESKQNDFTAELKYTKVGEINDPVYKYTTDGQLVRIVKK